MADMFGAGPTMQGGSGAVNPGSAAYYGFQQELLRRQQQQEAAAELQRQAQQDELNKQLKLEALATTKADRESLAAERAATTKASTLKSVASTLTPGAEVDPETAAALQSSGGGALMLRNPATPALEAGGPIENATPADIAATPAVAAKPAITTYRGDAAQQELEQHKTYAKNVVAALKAKQDNGEELTPVEQEALFQGNSILMTGKSATVPAGVIVPKAPAAAKDASRYFDIGTRMQTSPETVTAEDKAFAKTYETQHPTEATKQRDAVQKLNITINATDTRQNKSQLFTMKQKFRDDLKAEDAKLAPDLERVDRAQKVLNSPNFLADALAAPEVLQIMAGGMGSGLRMTDAELNRVNRAQTKLDQLRGEVAKYGLGTPVTIQQTMRDQMKELIDVVHKARARHAQLLEDTRGKIADADSPEDVDQMVAAFWGKRREAINLGEAPATGGLPAGVTVRKR